MTIHEARELHNHLNVGLFKYIAKLLELDKPVLIGMAADIAVVHDVYYRFTHYDFDDFEAGRLLDMENPVEAIAAEWGEYLETFDDDDFEDFLTDLLDDDDFFGDELVSCDTEDAPVRTGLESMSEDRIGELLCRLVGAAEEYFRSASQYA